MAASVNRSSRHVVAKGRSIGVGFTLLMTATSALSQTSSEQAVNLLRLSLQCPIKPLTIQGTDTTVTRRTIVNSYGGDAKSLKVSIETAERDHTVSGNFVMNFHSNPMYVAQFRDLSAVERRDLSLIIQCVGQRKCIQSSRAYSHYTEKQTQGSLTLNVCNQKAAEDAKVAIEELIRINSSPAK
jgi:hypothetical protein